MDTNSATLQKHAQELSDYADAIEKRSPADSLAERHDWAEVRKWLRAKAAELRSRLPVDGERVGEAQDLSPLEDMPEPPDGGKWILNLDSDGDGYNVGYVEADGFSGHEHFTPTNKLAAYALFLYAQNAIQGRCYEECIEERNAANDRAERAEAGRFDYVEYDGTYRSSPSVEANARSRLRCLQKAFDGQVEEIAALHSLAAENERLRGAQDRLRETFGPLLRLISEGATLQLGMTTQLSEKCSSTRVGPVIEPTEAMLLLNLLAAAGQEEVSRG